MPFITLTPNLALDRTLELNQALSPETLHRVRHVREVAGGKGVNVARVLKTLGAEVTVAGFLGGFNGQKFRHLLEQEGLAGVFQDVKGETRECHILLDEHPHPTEVYEKGPVVTVDDWHALVARLPEGQLIVSGSLPEGITPEAFQQLLLELPHSPVVDASGAALRAALEAGVMLVKPNRAELMSLVPIRGNGTQEAQVLYERYGVPLLLTLGAEGAAYIGEETHIVAAPSVEAVNPVASGDALLAAFLWARAEGWALDKALRLGIAAGAENAVQGGGARFSRAAVLRRLESLV